MYVEGDINLVHKMKKILSKQINNENKLFMKVNDYRSNLIDMARAISVYAKRFGHSPLFKKSHLKTC